MNPPVPVPPEQLDIVPPAQGQEGVTNRTDLGPLAVPVAPLWPDRDVADERVGADVTRRQGPTVNNHVFK